MLVMPGSRGEVDTRVQTRFISGGASNREWPGVSHSLSVIRLFHSLTTIIFTIRFTVLVLFDSVPTRFCLGTWQMLLSSPLLVMWKSNPLALGPRLIALLKVVTRVLNQVAQAHQ